MRHRVAGLAARASAIAGLICTAAAAAPPVSGGQATYDAAQAALDKQDWAGAAAGFATLLPSDPSARLSRSHAVIAAELAEALIRLNRLDEARGWNARAIDALPPGDAMLPSTWMTAGDAARFAYDYPAAIAAYDKAMPLAVAAGDPATARAARLALAYAAVTVDPARAATELDAALAQSPPAPADKLELAEIEDMRARAAMNAGDLRTATHWIERALDHSGGLTYNVTYLQAGIRGDAAIIYRLRGDDEQTRTLLTYTGAGHMKETNWVGRFQGELPVCGADGGVQPQDSAVVQFVLGDDGKVAGAIPVYASRSGAVGETFARAVSAWRWSPAALKDVDGFWRSTLRLELRCETRPPPDSLSRPYARQVLDWLVSRALLTFAEAATTDDADGVVVPVSNNAIVRALLGAPRGSSQQRELPIADAERLLDEARAPPSAYALLVFRRAAAQGGDSVRASERARASVMAPLVPALMQRFPNDPAAAWLALEYALALEASGEFAQAQPFIRSVLATPESVLPAGDPVRRVAQLHDALILAKSNDAAGAQASLAKSGLDAGQCSLFDTHPIPESVAIGSSAFPAEAMRWKFEGYVEEAFDITDNGHVANIRTIVAYPPFIFGPSTESAVRGFRYAPPSIGGKAVGCSGETQRVSYRIP